MNWYRLNTIAEIHSPWIDFFCERWKNEQGQELDYWRIEKADSVIVLPLWNNTIVLPPPFFRVGVNKLTYDFPGGRVHIGKAPHEMVTDILKRELGVKVDSILTIEPLNHNGWLINSAFSNQKLYAFIAEIKPDYSIPKKHIGRIFTNDMKGIQDILSKIVCLQCRAVLLEWLINCSQ